MVIKIVGFIDILKANVEAHFHTFSVIFCHEYTDRQTDVFLAVKIQIQNPSCTCYYVSPFYDQQYIVDRVLMIR